MENSQWLKAIFDNAIDGIVVIDKNGLIETINPAVNDLFGYTSDELLGNNISMLMPEPHKSKHDKYISDYRETGIKKIIGIGREVEGKKKDGSLFHFFLSVSELTHEKERKFLGVIHDISVLKAKEADLRMSTLQLEAVFETAIEGIVIIDDKGKIERINKAIINLFQYSSEELIGKNVKILTPPKHSVNHDKYINNYKKTRIPKIIGIGREVEGMKKDGSFFPMNLSVTELKVNNRTLFAGIIHDISAQKEAETKIKNLNVELEEKVVNRTEELSSVVSKLLTANKSLEKEVAHRIKVEQALRKSETEVRAALENEKELSDLKSRFVSMASHEFRTPLSTIRSSAEIIKLYNKDEQQFNREKHISRIKSAVNNLTSILDDFLSLSKLEENKIELNFSEFSLNELCSEIKDEMKPLLKSGQEIIFTSEQNINGVYSDKRLIKNIMYNMLSNAIKYSPEDKPIYCRKKVIDDMIHLELEDKGIGIPEKDKVHMFDRFFRATNATNIQGTGLGLNIVKSYLDLLNGDISFESEEGKGTIFKIKIPLKAEEQ